MRGYTESECRRAENRILRDMDRIELAGGQGRDAEDVRQSGSIWGWLLLIAVVVAFVGLLAGCGTVAGFGQDLQAVSEGVRAEMAKD